MRGHAHDESLARAYLVVADASAVLLQHPDAILLARIDPVYPVPSAEGFEVQVRECLMTPVILGAHITVELAVVHIRKPFLELRRLRLKPFREACTDFVYLGVGKLYGLAVTHLDVVAVVVLADALVDVRHSVVQGVFQKVHPVVTLVIALDGKLFVDLHVLVVARHGKLVHAVHIRDFDIGIIKVCHIRGVYPRGNPPFPEVEVQLVEQDRGWHCVPQCSKGLICGIRHVVSDSISFIVKSPFENVFHFLHDIPCYETVLDFVAVLHRVVIDASFERLRQFGFAVSAKTAHIFHIHAAVLVERGGKRIFRCLHADILLLRK